MSLVLSLHTDFTSGFFSRSSVFYCVSVCFKIREFFIYFIKIKAGVLYAQAENRMAWKSILYRGNSSISGYRIVSCFIWIGDTNTRCGYKHR